MDPLGGVLGIVDLIAGFALLSLGDFYSLIGMIEIAKGAMTLIPLVTAF
ncbi:hypothetical protein HUU53_02085 [Candidatus Micrarchaeota archaeon]|nr:hypothetical protein [Candidatus Micrarchaeota archaeon]